jgi:hypothetical protein
MTIPTILILHGLKIFVPLLSLPLLPLPLCLTPAIILVRTLGQVQELLSHLGVMQAFVAQDVVFLAP